MTPFIVDMKKGLVYRSLSHIKSLARFVNRGCGTISSAPTLLAEFIYIEKQFRERIRLGRKLVLSIRRSALRRRAFRRFVRVVDRLYHVRILRSWPPLRKAGHSACDDTF
jgi:hypothetical protein